MPNDFYAITFINELGGSSRHKMSKPNKKKHTTAIVHGPKLSSQREMKQHLKDYASATTAHGIAYLAEDGRPKLEKVFWIVIVILAIVFSYYQCATLYKQWQDDPVITTLDTVSLPIHEIEFPAVTICPQGSIKSIAETVLFLQLSRFIRNKREAEVTRKKRSDESTNAAISKSPGNGSLEMTYDEMMSHVEEFLREVYPGATDKPTKMVHLLTSNQPKKSFTNDAVMYQSFDEKCDAATNQKTLESLNKKLTNDPCPDGFKMGTNNTCLHFANTQMTFNDATDYCQQQGGSQLLQLVSYEALKIFNGYGSPG